MKSTTPKNERFFTVMIKAKDLFRNYSNKLAGTTIVQGQEEVPLNGRSIT